MYGIERLKDIIIYRDYSGTSLFRVFVIALILISGFSQLTEYENLMPVATDLTTKILTENQNGNANQQILGNTGQMLVNSINQQCKSQDTMLVPVSLGYRPVSIDCKKIRENGESGLAQYITDSIMKDYYKDYECNPIGCMVNMLVYRRAEEASYFFSAEMNAFLKKLIPFLFLATFISLVMIIRSTRQIFPIIKEVGTILLKIAGIPFLFLMIIVYRETIFVSTGIFSGKEEFMVAINNFFSGPTNLLVTIFASILTIPFILGVAFYIITYINEKKPYKIKS